MSQSILILPGDGIGPEVAKAAKDCLEAVAALEGLEFTFSEAPFGGAGIDACGEPLPEETLKAAEAADAIFLGAVGGPQGALPGQQLLADAPRPVAVGGAGHRLGEGRDCGGEVGPGGHRWVLGAGARP